MNKICKSCRLAKNTENFNKHLSNRDGISHVCKSCQAVLDRARHQTLEFKEKHRIETRLRRKNNPEKTRAYDKKWRGKNPDLLRNNQLKTTYRITLEDYKKLLEVQNNKCAICDFYGPYRKEKLLLFVDHDHRCCQGSKSCGKCIRGLICYKCNVGLGHFEGKHGRNSIFLKALKYIENRIDFSSLNISTHPKKSTNLHI